MTLRLLSYNIRFGGTGREAAIAAMIRSAAPDVVVLQEAKRPDVVRRLAAATEMTSWDAKPAHSVGFMSRVPVARHAWHRPPPCNNAFLELELPGVRVFGVHLSAVHSNWTEQRRARELRATLASVARHAAGLHALVGDFNTLAPGETFNLDRLPLRLRLVALLGGQTIRWQTVQMLLDAGYTDAFRSLHPDAPGHTFPTWDPHIRLDYAFVPNGAVARLARCEVLDGAGARDASDHLPLLLELAV